MRVEEKVNSIIEILKARYADAPCALQIDGETVKGVTFYSVSAKALAKV